MSKNAYHSMLEKWKNWSWIQVQIRIHPKIQSFSPGPHLIHTQDFIRKSLHNFLLILLTDWRQTDKLTNWKHLLPSAETMTLLTAFTYF